MFFGKPPNHPVVFPLCRKLRSRGANQYEITQDLSAFDFGYQIFLRTFEISLVKFKSFILFHNVTLLNRKICPKKGRLSRGLNLSFPCLTDLEVTTGEHGHVHSLGERHGQLLDPPDWATVQGDRHQDWLARAVHTVVQTYLSIRLGILS